MATEKRLSANPVAHLSKLKAETDRRIERHPYSVEELALVLAAAESGGIVHGMTGHERAPVYRRHNKRLALAGDSKPHPRLIRL